MSLCSDERPSLLPGRRRPEETVTGNTAKVTLRSRTSHAQSMIGILVREHLKGGVGRWGVAGDDIISRVVFKRTFRPQDYSEMQYRRRHRRRSRGDMLSLHNLRSSSNTPESSRRSDNTGRAARRNVLSLEKLKYSDGFNFVFHHYYHYYHYYCYYCYYHCFFFSPFCLHC